MRQLGQLELEGCLRRSELLELRRGRDQVVEAAVALASVDVFAAYAALWLLLLSPCLRS